MANINELNINELMTELIAIKENAIDGNVCDLNKSQISVQSMDSDKVVIHFNLNEEKLIESSICDQNNDNKSPDNSYDESEPNTRLNDKSQNSANDSNKDSACDSTEESSKPFKSRSSRRTISESTNEESTKGILKYSHNWIRRTVSESHCDSVDPDLDLLSIFWHSVEDVYSEDEICYEKKPKKNVRFSENISKTVFRPNSSILGRKSKNQKRAKNRKNSNRKPDTQSTDENNKNKLESERSRQDSGYDSEDNGLQYLNEISLKPHNKLNDCFEMETGIKKLTFN